MRKVEILESMDQGKRKRRLVLITVCIALMAVIASVTGLNVAQPKLAIEFNASQSKVLWMINIYTISLAALLLPLGALGDMWGRRRMLIAGLLVFGLASLASGLAGSTDMMLIARFMSGVGAAMIMPVTLAVITSTFPEEERSRAIGIWTAVAGGGGILGMYLSALLVDLADWRWLFLLPVILVLVSIFLTLRFIADSQEKNEQRFDVIGSLLSVISVFGIVFALHEAPGKGWLAPLTIGGLVVGVVCTIGFVLWERTQKEAIVDMWLFRDRGLSSGSLSLLTVFGVQAGILIVLFPYFQGVLGWSGLQSTLGMMPMAAAMMIASGLAPRVALRMGSRFTMAVGVAVGCGGLAFLAIFVSVSGGYLSVLPGMLIMGLGMGLSMSPATEVITSSLPPNRQGLASALNDVTRELGTALGVALLGALVTSGYSAAIDTKLNNIPSEIAAKARQGMAHAIEVAPNAGSRSSVLIQAARESFVAGWQEAMWAGVGVMMALFLFIVMRGPGIKTLTERT